MSAPPPKLKKERKKEEAAKARSGHRRSDTPSHIALSDALPAPSQLTWRSHRHSTLSALWAGSVRLSRVF